MNFSLEKFTGTLKKSLRDRELRSLALTFTTTVIIFTAVFYAYHHYTAGKNQVERGLRMSVYNSGSSGAMALREFIEKTGIPTGRILRSLDRFDLESDADRVIDERGLIIFLEPQVPIQKKEVLMAAKLAERGYSVLFAAAGEEKQAGFLHTLSADSHRKVRGGMYLAETKKSPSRLLRDVHGIFRDVKMLETVSGMRFRTWHSDWRPLVKDSLGVLAVEKSIGKGKLVLLSEGAFVTNLNIGRADNGIFIHRLVKTLSGEGRVYFDEFHHGHGRRFTLLYFFARREYAVLALHLALFALLLAIAGAVRFGQYRLPREVKDEKIFYYSRGLSTLLKNSSYRKDLAEHMVEGFKKFNSIHPEKAFREKIRRIDKILETAEKGKMRAGTIKKLFSIIRS